MPATHYQLLGVRPAATAAEIRAAYRALAVQVHPDKGGDPAQWEQLQKAHDTLCDDALRLRYDRQLTGGGDTAWSAIAGEDGYEAADSQSAGVVGRFVGGFRAGAADVGAGAGAPAVAGRLLGQIEQHAADEAHERRSRGPAAVAERGQEISHSDGFAAWLRNHQASQVPGSASGFFTGDDLVAQGLIATTGVLDVPLPELRSTGVTYEGYGEPAEVVRLCDALPCQPRLEHGQVLVRMLCAPVSDEDLLRLATPLHTLNGMPPFDQPGRGWAEVELPAVAGVDGVGIVVATARRDDSDDSTSPYAAAAAREGGRGGSGAGADGVAGTGRAARPAAAAALEVKQWVVVEPQSRLCPVGTWQGLLVCDESRLLGVPSRLMPVPMLACARSLATAYRLLEDYGELRPGDVVIQNAAAEAVGCAVLQLCKLLRLRCINVLADSPDFLAAQAGLKQLYGDSLVVVRDGPRLAEGLAAVGGLAPCLSLDAIGGEAGRRLLRTLRPGGNHVCYAVRSARTPQLDVSLLLYQQLSLHGFSLSTWVQTHGAARYLTLLQALAPLVQRDKLVLPIELLPLHSPAPDGDSGDDDDRARRLAAALRRATHGHAAVADVEYPPRPKIVLELGTEAQANATYFELAEHTRRGGGGGGQAPAPGGGDGGGGAAGQPAPAPPSAPPPVTASSVAELLAGLGLGQYEAAFEAEELDLETLRAAALRPDELRETLKELGLKKLGHREKIMAALVH
jgi:trans-2-enoyl-CoA reductase